MSGIPKDQAGVFRKGDIRRAKHDVEVGILLGAPAAFTRTLATGIINLLKFGSYIQSDRKVANKNWDVATSIAKELLIATFGTPKQIQDQSSCVICAKGVYDSNKDPAKRAIEGAELAGDGARVADVAKVVGRARRVRVCNQPIENAAPEAVAALGDVRPRPLEALVQGLQQRAEGVSAGPPRPVGDSVLERGPGRISCRAGDGAQGPWDSDLGGQTRTGVC